MLGQDLARLNKLGVLALPEALEYLHRPLDGGGCDGAFEDIGHTATTAVWPPGFLRRWSDGPAA
jgi:hypothetical protein